MERPNPGSNEAIAQGCTCPVLDNNYGKSAPWPPDGWWMVEGCPVHTVVPLDDAETVAHSGRG